MIREDFVRIVFVGLFAELSHFVGERFASLPPSALNHLGAFIEQCLESPASNLYNAAATMFPGKRRR
jgi:hypothetical protein